jgi:quinol monooxygenase YgiN
MTGTKPNKVATIETTEARTTMTDPMAEEIVSVVALESLPRMENELLRTLREFYTLMHEKGYSRDSLYRDAARPDRFLHVRRWGSAELRGEAQADPEVHHFWQKLPDLCTVTVLHESMEKVFETK